MPNELDELMDKDPMELSEQDIQAIIAYQRKQRAQVESGVKLKKETGPRKEIDLLSLGLIKAKPAGASIKRRV